MGEWMDGWVDGWVDGWMVIAVAWVCGGEVLALTLSHGNLIYRFYFSNHLFHSVCK